MFTQSRVERETMKIYVGNLSYDVTNNDLEEAFSEFGQVSSVNVLIDKQTGRSKGFGFVEMPHAGEAKAAMKNLNATLLDDSIIRVKKAVPKPPPDTP